MFPPAMYSEKMQKLVAFVSVPRYLTTLGWDKLVMIAISCCKRSTLACVSAQVSLSGIGTSFIASSSPVP
jgi:hypothetical protein